MVALLLIWLPTLAARAAPGWLYDEDRTFTGKTPGTRLLFKAK